MIELLLPVPVSLNQLYHNQSMKNGGGRSKTKKSKAWMRDAKYYASTFIKEHSETCNYNVALRNKHWSFKKKTYLLKPLHVAHPTLSYHVSYAYAFADPRAVKPRDLANFEKQLSDFLVDMGFMLDDSFIDDLHIKRLPPSKENPHVKISIKTLDLNPYLY